MKLLTLLLSLLLSVILSVPARAATFEMYQTTWNPPAGSAEAQQWGLVPVSAFAKEVKPCFWTGNNSEVWPDPPTDRQVQTAAGIGTNGGANPYGPASGQVQTFPRNTLVMLDAEGRSDDAIRDMVTRYRAAAGPRPKFCVFALRYTLSNGAWPWWAANQFGWTRSFEARRLLIRDITDRTPIVLLDLYVNEEKIDQQLAALDFFVTNLRRLYSDKRLYVITRGDSFPPGSNGTFTHRMDPELMERMAAYIRSRFDGAIVWGIRGAGNVEFAEKVLRPRGWDAEIR